MNIYKGFDVKLDNLKLLIQLLEEHNLTKLQVKDGAFEALFEKQPAVAAQPLTTLAATSAAEHAVEKKAPVAAGNFVVSPMVGTLYEASGSGRPPFVKVGDWVEPDKVVCIIEAMKVMNEVKAGVRGVVKEILVENGHPVEYGSKLFRVE